MRVRGPGLANCKRPGRDGVTLRCAQVLAPSDGSADGNDGRQTADASRRCVPPDGNSRYHRWSSRSEAERTPRRERMRAPPEGLPHAVREPPICHHLQQVAHRGEST
jgi:hypothetical protein